MAPAVALNTLGDVTRAQGNYVAACSLYKESLAIARKLADKRGIAYCLEGLAQVACAQRQYKQAGQLLSVAAALRLAIGAPLRASELADNNRDVASVRAGLGEEGFTSAWAEGRAMTLERAIEYALAQDST